MIVKMRSKSVDLRGVVASVFAKEKIVKTKRVVYRVGWSKKWSLWQLLEGKAPMLRDPAKVTVVGYGRRSARLRWKERGEPSQLVVHKKDGKVEYEHTYGRDPRRSRG